MCEGRSAGDGDLSKGQRIIFVNRFFYPDESATAQLLTDLSTHLASAGFEVIVVTSRATLKGDAGNLPAISSYRGMTIKRLGVFRRPRDGIAGKLLDYLSFLTRLILALRDLCRSGDVVVAKTDPPLLSFVVALATIGLDVKRVIWLQDLYPEVAAALGVRGAGGLIKQAAVSLRDWSLKGAVVNIVIGERMRQRLLRAGVPEERVRVIPNWVDEASITPLPSSNSLRSSWGLDSKAFVIGYSGNLGRAHEADTVLGAARLLANRKDIKFLLVGDGYELHHLRERVETEGLQNFVFQPHQPQSKLAETLAVSDVHWLSLRPELEGLIVPSKFYGIAAAGRPLLAVVAQDGEIAEIVRSLDCGFVVSPGDQGGLAATIIALADNPALCARIGQRARIGLEANYGRALALARWETLLLEIAEDTKGKHVPAVSN